MFCPTLLPYLKLRQNFQVQITVLTLDILNGLHQLSTNFSWYVQGIIFLLLPRNYFQSALRKEEDIVILCDTISNYLHISNFLLLNEENYSETVGVQLLSYRDYY